MNDTNDATVLVGSPTHAGTETALYLRCGLCYREGRQESTRSVITARGLVVVCNNHKIEVQLLGVADIARIMAEAAERNCRQRLGVVAITGPGGQG